MRGNLELLAKMEAELYEPGSDIKLSDFITKEEFDAHPTGELYLAIQLAQKRNNAANGAKRERERIIQLLEAKGDLSNPEWKLTEVIALIKGKNK